MAACLENIFQIYMFTALTCEAGEPSFLIMAQVLTDCTLTL